MALNWALPGFRTSQPKSEAVFGNRKQVGVETVKKQAGLAVRL